jgi:hypothetical protein
MTDHDPAGDIDPTNMVNVEELIFKLMKRSSWVTKEVRRCAEAAAEAETAYRVAYAKAFLRADGPVAEREAKATEACETELSDRKMADALLLSAQEAGRNVREQLQAARTLCANLRAAVGNATGMGG